MSVEWKAINNVERNKSHKKTLKRYLMLDNSQVNWFWDEQDVLEFDRLFREGYTIKQLAKFFKRPAFEIVLLTIDRDLRGKLEVEDEYN